MRCWSTLLFGIACILGPWLPSASAQRARAGESLLDRPATRGPSTRMGGNYTRAQNLAPLAAPQGGIALLPREQFRPRRVGPPSQYLESIRPEQLGLMSTPPGMPAYSREVDPQLAMITGLSTAESLELPIPGVGRDYLPDMTAYRYTPRPERTRFQTIFGLEPPPSKPPPAEAIGYPERLRALTEERVTEARIKGLELFRGATTSSAEAGLTEAPAGASGADLLEAVRYLRLARDLQSEDYLPALLIAHALMAESRPSQAAAHLLYAFGRRPDQFFYPVRVTMSVTATTEEIAAVLDRLRELRAEPRVASSAERTVLGLSRELSPEECTALAALPGVERVGADAYVLALEADATSEQIQQVAAAVRGMGHEPHVVTSGRNAIIVIDTPLTPAEREQLSALSAVKAIHPRDLVQCFGDSDGSSSRYLGTQMRRYVLGDWERAPSDLQLLAAYSAWRLGDYRRARQIASHLEQRARDNPEGESAETLGFVMALQAALAEQR